MSPLPKTGDLVLVRHRHYLVTEAKPAAAADNAGLVRLSCLDDDAPGEPLAVLWERELGASVLPRVSLPKTGGLDDPRRFGAWLCALQWSCATATEPELLQAPFRAGIEVKPYQLEPLRKALALPRVNLFIADDVGLGKTIEAGLVLQELLLRARIDRVLVVCPPSVTLQWQEELSQRFGLSFAIYDRDFVAARRRQRGWGVNPWATHTRFIVSTTLLRGSSSAGASHREMLIRLLADLAGDHKGLAPRTLLIFDEAHLAAPATGARYSRDTLTTGAIREIASFFEHRLFLSATPHNGHQSSFSTLLAMLDPQRFTPGVPVSGPDELAPVLVRRLKRDLRALVGGLPERQLKDHAVVLPPDAPEVRLGALLARYEVLYKQSLQGAGVRDVDARALVCVSLHKRLLSSVAAFRRTVEVHARAAEQLHRRALHLPLALPDPDEIDPVDEEQVEDETVSQLSLRPSAEALDVLSEMRRIAAVNAEIPDARLKALASWIRDHLRPDGRWRPTRLVVFTEYDDTLQWMARHLPALLGLPRGDWLATWSGKLHDDSRHELHERFNADPGREPLRVLLATDAAREGLNLQAWCHNLFHFDLPWNPARIEQRNGRIDRTLQPEPVVYCHYLHVQGRVEDRVLAHLVRKVETIHRDLGSLSDVLSARITERLQLGLRGVDEAEIDRLSRPDQAALEAVSALEGRGARGALTGDLALLDRLRQRSEARLGWRPEHLHLLVDQGLKLVSRDGKGLGPTDGGYALPELDESWSPLVDALRGPPPPNAHFKARGKVRPVTVRPSNTLNATAVQLHLGHPIVKRLSALFLSQGWSSSALHRLTVLPSTERVRRVLAFGRLSLFGQGASRLHEELIFVSAQILADGTLKPLGERGRETGEATLAELLAAAPGLHPDPRVRYQVLDRASADVDVLDPLLDAAQEAARERASALLEARAEAEASAMLAVLDSARQGILDTQARARQRDLFATGLFDRAEQAKLERDLRDMVKRLDHIDEEREREPARIRAGYKVERPRFQRLGLAYLWPEST